VNHDGNVDVSDVLCEIDAFSGIFTACTREGTDLTPCVPDGNHDLGEVLAVLDAFAGLPYPCDDPCDGGAGAPEGAGEGPMGPEGEGGEGPMGGGGSTNYVIALLPASGTVSPGGTVSIHAFVEGPLDLRGYEVAVDVTGGSSGSLTVETLNVDTQRLDFVLFGQSPDPLTPTNLAERRLAGALWSGGVIVGPVQKYAGTFTFKASRNAAGTFQIALRTPNCSLRDSNSQTLSWSAGSPAQITVEE
jgi:hypothetical protein